MVGMAKAMEIAVFDDPIPAARCLELGLATKVVDDGESLNEARAMAVQLAERSQHALGWAKKLFAQSFDTPLEAQLELEREGLAACGGHADGQEGMRAFAEKRKPRFNRQ